MPTGVTQSHKEVTLEFYRQACVNARMFVDLRFKHFTTFMVITGLLGAAAFNVPGLNARRIEIIFLAHVVTVLFWFLDFRTSQLWRHEFEKVRTFERALNEGFHLILPPPEKSRLKASTATSLLFCVILISWLTAFLAMGQESNKKPSANISPPPVGAASGTKDVASTVSPTAAGSTGPTSFIPVPVGQESASLLLAFIFMSGVVFLVFTKSRPGRYVGGSLILITSFLSGLKLLNIEKLISINEINWQKSPKTEEHYSLPSPPLPSPPRPAYSLTYRLPPFKTASALPTSKLVCAAQLLSYQIAQLEGVHTVVVVSGADRRGLLPDAKRVFSSNWALAQQRGTAVASALVQSLPQGVALIVTNAGPSNTFGNLDDDLLSQDRAPIVHVSGFGTASTAALEMENTSWAERCPE